MKQISLEWTLLELAQSCPGKACVFNHPLIARVRDLTWAHVGALLFFMLFIFALSNLDINY